METAGSEKARRGTWGLTVAAAVVLGALACLWIGGCAGGAFTGAPADHRATGADAADDVTTIYVLQPDASTLGDAARDGGALAADATEEPQGCDPTVDPRTDPCVLEQANGVFVASPLAVDGGVGPFVVDAGTAGDGGDAGTAGDAGSAGDASTTATGDAAASGDGGASGDAGARADGAAEGGAPALGSAGNPFPTISAALGNLGGKSRVYVCTGLYMEEVDVPTPVSIYGGLTCAHGIWGYDGSRATVRSPTTHGFFVQASGTTTIEDIEFVARNTHASDGFGASSIAGFVSSGALSLQRVTLIAGFGAPGAPGADGIANPNYVAAVAPQGNGPTYAFVNGDHECPPCDGGAPVENTCLLFGTSGSGAGGYGCIEYGTGLAGVGQAQPPAPATPGRDGVPWDYPLSDGGLTAQANPGADGLGGAAGASGPTQQLGSFTPGGSWSPAGGGQGGAGSPGQGGAGGTDSLYILCEAPTIDLGGSSGGAGGCGGAGGGGGLGGGGSIALGALGAAVDLKDCTLVAGNGGAGGSGGAGQNGQGGGLGGTAAGGLSNGASDDGEPGGNGGGGSGGTGGNGGISAGIVYQGTQLTCDTATLMSVTLGAPGQGGAGGAAGLHQPGVLSTGNDGLPGQTGTPGTAVAVLNVSR